jgi:hypothetical protein
MIGVPREGWRPLVEHAVGQRETSVSREAPTSRAAVEFAYRFGL